MSEPQIPRRPDAECFAVNEKTLEKPTEAQIKAAEREWYQRHYGNAETGAPAVNFIDGELSIEWWNGQRSLTIFASERELPKGIVAFTYLKAWGTDCDKEMEDGALLDQRHLIELRDWLRTAHPPKASQD